MEQSAVILPLEDVGEGPYKLLFDTDEEELPYDLQKMQEDIATNTSSISSLNTEVTKNTNDISLLDASVTKNTSNIKTITNELTYYSNPNLLDNWYFLNPINQRGQTEYIGDGFLFDRWRTYTSWAKTTLTSNGVVIQNTSSTDYATIVYYAPFTDFNTNNVYTISMLLGTNELLSFIVTPLGAYAGSSFDTSNTVYIDSYTSNNVNLAIRISVEKNKTSPPIVAVKLELGTQQTLAHQDSNNNWILNDAQPNYAETLAKCQRYQVVFNRENTDKVIGFAKMDGALSGFIFLPVPMRAIPSIVAQQNNVMCRFVYNDFNGNNTGIAFLGSLSPKNISPTVLRFSTSSIINTSGTAIAIPSGSLGYLDVYVNYNVTLILDANL